MLPLLALLASCEPLSQAKTVVPPTAVTTDTLTTTPPPVVATVAEVRMPAGQAIVRQCYGNSREQARRGSGYPTTSAPPPPSVPMSAPAKKSAQPGGGSDGYGGLAATGSSGVASASSGTTVGGGAGYSQSQRATADAAPVATTATAAPKAEARPNAGPGYGAMPEVAGAPAMTPPADSAAARAGDEGGLAQNAVEAKPDTRTRAPSGATEHQSDKEKDASASRYPERSAPSEEPARDAADSNLDWGATVYLSNDDSMSLASAQRLLWAIQNKSAVSASQIRPHELLNYFSFETDPVAPGNLFSVKGSAEQTDSNVLTLAFAVKGVTPARKPLDLTMVLDRSGSMTAEGRMEYLKRGLTKMSDQLQRGDRIDLVLFDDQVCTPLENYVVGRDDPALLTQAIADLTPRGSTDLDAGLKEGYRIANARTDTAGRNRRMMLISDALLNTGDVNPNTVTEVAKAYEESGVRLTAVGVGRDFNDKILDMLSEKGKGAYVYLGSEAVVDRVFGIGFESLVQTIAHDVHFQLDLPPSLAMKKFYGEEASTDRDDVQPINYYAGTTQLFLQDLQLRGRPVPSDPIALTIQYKDADTGRDATQEFHTTVGALLDSDPRNMRKGRALMAWTDMISARALGGSPCGAPFSAWQDRVNALGDDAEISWLDGLTSPLCGATPVVPKPVARGVAYKVKVDSDLPIAEVTLTCSGHGQTQSLSGSDTVARFASATPGACTLSLLGNVPMNAQVEVPETGGDIRCMVRGGRLSCG